MTLGDGIFWSTVVVLVAAGIYQVSVRKKWKLIGKVLAVLILAGTIVGGALWGWFEYQERPYVVEELAGIRLGMKPVEVKLTKGEPLDGDQEPVSEEDGKYRMAWIFKESDYDSAQHLVTFFGDTPKELGAGIVCEFGGYGDLLGVSTGWPEKRVIETLGQPSHTSIASEGLMKQISYERWQASYRIRKGRVVMLCISQSGRVTFNDEYDDAVEENTGEVARE